jgi:hypothetical protein
VQWVTILFLAISSIGIIQTTVKQQQIATDESTYQTIRWVADHVEGEAYPQTYVLSPWDVNYEFNYFASGWAGAYGYAKQQYSDFITLQGAFKTQPAYNRLRDIEHGYVAIQDTNVSGAQSVYTKLKRQHGSNLSHNSPLANFRVVYKTTDDGWTVLKYVNGTRIIGEAPPGTVVTITTNVSLSGKQIHYQRKVQSNQYGEYAVTVPYPGVYKISEKNSSIYVTNKNVTKGRLTSSYRSHIPFDSVQSGYTRDVIYGSQANTDAANSVAGVYGSAISFSDSSRVEFNGTPVGEQSSFTVSFWVKGNFSKTEETFPRAFEALGPGKIGIWGVFAGNESDLRAAVDDNKGQRFRVGDIRQVDFNRWTHIALTLDRKKEKLRLYKNGKVVAARNVSELGDVAIRRYTVGPRNSAPVAVDDVRIYNVSLDRPRVQDLYHQGTKNYTTGYDSLSHR